MRRIKTNMALLIAIVLMQNIAMAQKKEFNSAIKNKVYTFDGYYYVDLSKAAITEADFLSFAQKNGYQILSYKTEKVVQFGESMIGVTSAIMLPVGESPNIEKGHLNPADEPYKSMNAVVNDMIRKGPDDTGVYHRSFGDKGFRIEDKAALEAVIKAHNCIWTAYKTDAGWGKYAHVYTDLYFVDSGSMSEALLANSFSGVTLSKKKMNTGMAKLDPDKDEWESGITWTGEIIDGKISGNGHGAKVIDPASNQGLIVEGTFANGIPVGEVKYRYGKYDGLNKLSLYGQYNMNDFEHKSAGISMTLSPTSDPNVIQIVRSRITIDLFGKTDKHNTRMGFVDKSFQTLSWLPGNTEIVESLPGGKSVIKHRKHGVDNSGGAIFYQVSDKLDYVVSPDGKAYLADNELESLLTKYDRIMSFWDETLKPYLGLGNSYRLSSLSDALNQLDNWMNQVDNDFLSQKPVDYVKSKRSNYKQFEILRKLERLNKLVMPNENLSDSFVLDNPGYKRNSKKEADLIMADLRSNPDFNPVNIEKVFAEYDDRLERAIKSYAEVYAIALERHQQEMAEKEIKKAFEIDQYSTYDPSGKLYEIGLFSSYKTYEKDGKVTLRNGEYAVYNIVYTPSGELECYRLHYSTVGLSSMDFKSYNAMVNELSKASLKSK